MLRLKWLLYTVMVGLIPVLARLLVYVMSPRATPAFMWSETDVASFGLALNIANVSAIEHENTDPEWKTTVNGLSLLFVVFLGIVFTFAFLKDLDASLVSPLRLKQVAASLSVGSLALSYAVYNRLSRQRSDTR